MNLPRTERVVAEIRRLVEAAEVEGLDPSPDPEESATLLRDALAELRAAQSPESLHEVFGEHLAAAVVRDIVEEQRRHLRLL